MQKLLSKAIGIKERGRQIKILTKKSIRIINLFTIQNKVKSLFTILKRILHSTKWLITINS